MKRSLLIWGLILALFLTACQPAASVPPVQIPAETPVESPEPTPEPSQLPAYQTAVLAVAGDVMSHMPQTNDAYVAATARTAV